MRFFLSLFLLLWPFSLIISQVQPSSPLEKGALFTGTSGYFVNNRTTLGGLNAPITTVALSPVVQFFIQEHTALTIGAQVQSERIRTLSSSDQSDALLVGASLGLRQYYVIPSMGKWFIYNEIAVNARRGRTTQTLSGTTGVTIESGYGGNYNLGLAFVPASRLLFTLEIGSVYFDQSFSQPENSSPASRLQSREVGVRLISQGIRAGLNVRLNKPK